MKCVVGSQPRLVDKTKNWFSKQPTVHFQPQMTTLAISDEVRVFIITYTDALILLKSLPYDEETDYIKTHLYEYGVKHSENRPLIVTPEYYDLIYKTL